MKMRLIILQSQLIFLVKCVLNLISLLTCQIWLQITFGCFRKKKKKQKKNPSPLLSRDENLRPIMIFRKNKAQIPQSPLAKPKLPTVGNLHGQRCCRRQGLLRRPRGMEPNSGWMCKFGTRQFHISHFMLSGQRYPAYEREAQAIYSKSIS